MRELDKRVDTLNLTSLAAWRGSMQSSTHAEGGVYFFGSVAGVASDSSSVLAAQALAFEVEDVAFEQSQAT